MLLSEKRTSWLKRIQISQKLWFYVQHNLDAAKRMFGGVSGEFTTAICAFPRTGHICVRSVYVKHKEHLHWLLSYFNQTCKSNSNFMVLYSSEDVAPRFNGLFLTYTSKYVVKCNVVCSLSVSKDLCGKIKDKNATLKV